MNWRVNWRERWRENRAARGVGRERESGQRARLMRHFDERTRRPRAAARRQEEAEGRQRDAAGRHETKSARARAEHTPVLLRLATMSSGVRTLPFESTGTPIGLSASTTSAIVSRSASAVSSSAASCSSNWAKLAMTNRQHGKCDKWAKPWKV